MVWYGMVWHGMAWHGLVWFGLAWYGMYVSTCMHDSHALLQCSENDSASNLSCLEQGLTEKCRPCPFFLLDLKAS